jgi:DNA-binding transcriptional ArsR family regulator
MKEEHMDNERHQILLMLKEGKISVEEAERLLSAVGSKAEQKEPAGENSKPKSALKYLRIVEHREGTDEENYERHLNIRIPLALLRAGAKLQSILPEDARGKIESRLKDKFGGVGENLLEPENMEALMEALREEGIAIEIDKPGKKFSIFCE